MESKYPEDHPRTILPDLCRKFYSLGWMYGTGGALSVRTGDKIYITPSGVQKELVQGEDLFVQTSDGTDIDLPPAEKKLKKSTCTPLITVVYRLNEGCNAVYHVHNTAAVMVSMLWPGTEFRITHQKMIQCIKKGNSDKHFDYYDTMVVPIIENKSTEDEIAESMTAAMLDYPETSAILIRRHGMYVWGPSWQKVKCMAESFDYLFNVAVQMKQCGLDPEKIPVAPEGAYT
ncbi:methylthioribulose-1-phosphate dehydratase-like isoform X1 [Mercenaria mercenaria]|uniref:methylthioribulose-1-phosphate dehydratase-like isoform X1 n=1 Tax=Mercenaria mercenaria TaxID=6596 RepID=UPI00234F16BA|nr:methylthioribulose-1-phosphate dehydratase-like isoform X1 [Mercenaria mercenaria]